MFLALQLWSTWLQLGALGLLDCVLLNSVGLEHVWDYAVNIYPVWQSVLLLLLHELVRIFLYPVICQVLCCSSYLCKMSRIRVSPTATLPCPMVSCCSWTCGN